MNPKKAFHHEEHEEGHEDFPWGCMLYVVAKRCHGVNRNVVGALENLLFFFVFFVPFVVKPPFKNERRRNETE